MNRIVLALTVAAGLAVAVQAQPGGFDNARAFVGRVQADLNRATGLAHKDDDRERITKAQSKLSDFDKNLSKGKFDKDALDEAIEHVQDVIDHNTLSPGGRDDLKSDVKELRIIREKRGSI